MAPPPPTLAAVSPLAAVSRALDAVDLGDLGSLGDETLLELVGEAALVERRARAHSAALAGEVARRSHPDFGHDGLSQARGHRTPVKLIQSITGTTARDAGQAIRVGTIEIDAPWLRALTPQITSGAVSTDAADAIRAGLGELKPGVTTDQLVTAATQLADESTLLDADQLYRRARQLRDELDVAGIVDRERAARDARSFRLSRLRDGSVRAVWELDPLDGSVLAEIYDRATSPKRGGPRFVSQEHHATRITDDPRTIEQLASDTLLGLLTAGAEVNPTQLLGTGAPAVRVTITERDLRTRTGYGRLGNHPVSIGAIERAACTQGTITVVFDDHGRPLDVGREQRLFTPTQRTALAIRDGGCMWTGCERPPSWTEAHHIHHWKRDHGKTDIDDGILLCKHHHLLLHDHKWEIERRGLDRTEYWLIPPPGHPNPAPRHLESKSLALRDLLTG